MTNFMNSYKVCYLSPDDVKSRKKAITYIWLCKQKTVSVLKQAYKYAEILSRKITSIENCKHNFPTKIAKKNKLQNMALMDFCVNGFLVLMLAIGISQIQGQERTTTTPTTTAYSTTTTANNNREHNHRQQQFIN